MENHLNELRKFTANVDEKAVASIVKYCGIALRDADSAIVAATDRSELQTVRDGFAAKKLGLGAEAADAGIKAVVEKMKGTPRKSRVAFYYLLAEATGTLDKLG